MTQIQKISTLHQFGLKLYKNLKLLSSSILSIIYVFTLYIFNLMSLIFTFEGQNPIKIKGIDVHSRDLTLQKMDNATESLYDGWSHSLSNSTYNAMQVV